MLKSRHQRKHDKRPEPSGRESTELELARADDFTRIYQQGIDYSDSGTMWLPIVFHRDFARDGKRFMFTRRGTNQRQDLRPGFFLEELQRAKGHWYPVLTFEFDPNHDVIQGSVSANKLFLVPEFVDISHPATIDLSNRLQILPRDLTSYTCVKQPDRVDEPIVATELELVQGLVEKAFSRLGSTILIGAGEAATSQAGE